MCHGRYNSFLRLAPVDLYNLNRRKSEMCNHKNKKHFDFSFELFFSFQCFIYLSLLLLLIHSLSYYNCVTFLILYTNTLIRFFFLLQHTEALLYGFQSIAETIDVNYSDVIPGLIGLIPRININNVQLADTVMFTIGKTIKIIK